MCLEKTNVEEGGLPQDNQGLRHASPFLGVSAQVLCKLGGGGGLEITLNQKHGTSLGSREGGSCNHTWTCKDREHLQL